MRRRQGGREEECKEKVWAGECIRRQQKRGLREINGAASLERMQVA